MNNQASQKWMSTTAIAPNGELSSDDYELVIRQRPMAAKIFMGKEKDRKPIDPPPIVQLRISDSADPSQSYLQSPYFFVSTSLVDDDVKRPRLAGIDEARHGLAGTLVSSLHRLKDIDNSEGGFFVFGDLSVRLEGRFKLQFTLFEVRDKEVAFIKSITSTIFHVFATKNWPGMAESTFLTRSFSEQGVRLRLRKEPRFRLGVRGPASDNYEPRRYRSHRRRLSQEPLPLPPPPPPPPPPPQQQQQQSFQAYYQDQQGMNNHHQGMNNHQVQADYPGRHLQYMVSQPSLAPSIQRKRDFSQSDYHPGSQPDDSYFKRTRTDSEYPQQQSYATQHYPLFTDSSQASIFTSFPQQSPHHVYGGGYASSPSPITPRDQGSYLLPRLSDATFPPLTSYESATTRTSLRSPVVGFGFSAPLQPSLQAQYNMQPQPPQFVPQASQPSAPSRTAGHMPMYPMPVESEQVSLPSRSSNVPSSETLPPVFGRGTLQGIGMATSALTALPSMGEDPRYARNYMFDFKRDDSPNR